MSQGTPAYLQIDWLEQRVKALEAELEGQRMCVNCGKFRPANEPQDNLPECTGPDGLAACTWNSTPSEAWQFWRKKAHDQYVEIQALKAALAQQIKFRKQGY